MTTVTDARCRKSIRPLREITVSPDAPTRETFTA